MKANRSLPFRHSRRSTRAALLCLLALPITVGTSAPVSYTHLTLPTNRGV